MRLSSLLLAAAIAGGVYAWLALGPTAGGGEAAPAAAAQQAADEPAPVSVIAIESRARPLTDSVVLRGVTEAARKLAVKAQTGGLVISEPARKGARVAQGDLLCEIEPGERPAALAEAQARLRQAEADARASQTLSQRGFSADTRVAADAAALEAARAAVERIELDIARTRVTAPFAGVLETDAAETGALLPPGETCATLLALDPIRLVGYAPERAVDAIDVGAPAHARLVDGREIDAQISFVARSADPATRTFRVEATAANPDGAVRDGMTAEIVAPLEADPAHRIPHAALTLDDSGRLGVRLVEDGRAKFAPVTVLRDDAEGVWLAGLPQSATVMVVGQEFVTDGSAVRVTLREPTRDPSGAPAAETPR